MNKKILISLSVIGVVAAIAVGGTIAYFSDTETSTGNTFTAGKLDLQIDNTCHYYQNGQEVDCPWSENTWALTDLEDGVHKFFDFSDIKPGDWGEDTISLHVYNNDAWAWLKIDGVENYENDCNEPECEAEGGTWDYNAETCTGIDICGDPGLGEGELSQNMYFLIWMDDDGDNEYDTNERRLKGSEQGGENLSDCDYWQVGDQTCCEIDPLTGSYTYNVGIKWCFGTFDTSWDCQGTSVGNEAQSDSMEMDVSFIVVQDRNNPGAEGGPTCP